ncbi:MAG: tail fiber domain-containing protein [Bacteroidetes bacterium]|nr:tail fiber domain-containing protein [Bacteroidota bacterium]
MTAIILTNYARGQDYRIWDYSMSNEISTNFLQTNPFPTAPTTLCKLEVGKNYNSMSYRAILYGGNLGISQSITNFGQYLGKWSFTGAWQKKIPNGLPINWSFTPGINYLVNYHRWGDYTAHFGLRAINTQRNDVFPEGVIYTEAPQKDAVITWGYETGATPNRLIFQSIEGVDTTIPKTEVVEHEWATILSNGNVGIGISNPDAQLTIKNNLQSYSLIKTIDVLNKVPLEVTWNGDIKLNKVVNNDGVTTNILQVMPNGTLSSTPFSGIGSNINWSQTGNLTGYPPAKLGSLNQQDYEFISNGSTFLTINGDQAKSSYEGFSNFTRNVSISGGNQSTGLPAGGYKINDPEFSLTIKSSIIPSVQNYPEKGILNCIDSYNDPVFQIGNNAISIFNSVHQIGSNYSHFNGYVDFNGDIAVENLMPYSSSLSNIGSSTNRFNEIWCTIGNLNTSDKRLKENILILKSGLETVSKLKPYSFTLKEKNNKLHYGFIAQELKKIFPNSIVYGEETDSSYLGVIYSEFIPILTLAIQEQQAIIDSLKQKLELIFSLNKIKDEKNINIQKEILNKQPLLFQNHPNPFNGYTYIDYYLPENLINVFLKVTDNNGKLVKAFEIEKTGFGQVEIDCRELAAGMYYYSLITDSKIIDTKSMMIIARD